MSLLPNSPGQNPACSGSRHRIAAGRPFSARKALLVWVVLMLAAWLLVGTGIYAFLRPGI